jgi:hypothetical protein
MSLLAVAVSSVALAAAPASGLKLAQRELQTVGIDAELGRFYSEHLAQQLKLAGAEVITPQEMASLLGMERQRQLMGCGEGSCMAELANALGTDGLVLGGAAKVGGTFHFDFKIISSLDGKTVAAVSEEASGDSAALESIARSARALATQAAQALGRTLNAKFEQPKTSLKPGAYAAFAVGAAGLGIGIIFTVLAHNSWNALASGSIANAADGRALQNNGQTQQLISAVGYVFAAIGGATGIGLFVASPKATATVTPLPGGAGFAFAGALP